MLNKIIIKKIQNKLDIKKPIFLGKGGEGEVYEIDSTTVVKIYGETNFEYLESLKSFQERLSSYTFSFQVPEIYTIEQLDGQLYTIEKKLDGINGETLFEQLGDEDRKRLLKNFLLGLDELSQVVVTDLDYGQIISDTESISTKNWADFLVKKMNQRLGESQDQLNKDVKNLNTKIEVLEKVILKELSGCSKKLVHHDYYLNNVLMTDDCKLSAVLDFSPHTVVGDWRMDIAGAVTFLGINTNAKKYIPYMKSLVADTYGQDIVKVIDLYLLYYSIYYSDTYKSDRVSYDWCVENLNDEQLWNSINS